MISWSSQKQSTVALSSTEAEYVAASYACQEDLWLRQLLMDLNQAQQGPTTLYEHNQGCLKLALQENHSARTMHIDVRHQFLQDLQEWEIVDMEYCPTREMLADMLTKPLLKTRFEEIIKKLGFSF